MGRRKNKRHTSHPVGHAAAGGFGVDATPPEDLEPLAQRQAPTDAQDTPGTLFDQAPVIEPVMNDDAAPQTLELAPGWLTPTAEESPGESTTSPLDPAPAQPEPAPHEPEQPAPLMPSHSAPDQPQPHRRARAWSRARVRKYAGVALLASGVGAAVTLMVAALLARQTPSWYQQLDPRDPAVIASARRIENAVATALTRVRPDHGATDARQTGPRASAASREPFTLALSAADANAWLAVRLPGWLAHECDPPMDWPEEVSGVRVGFDSGRIRMGAGLSAGKGPEAVGAGSTHAQVLTAAVRPSFAGDGSLWTPASSLGVGRLSLPASLVLGASDTPPEQMPDSIAELRQTRDVIAALRGKQPTLSSPVIRIGDGRRLRLIAIEARSGKLYVTCQPLARGEQ